MIDQASGYILTIMLDIFGTLYHMITFLKDNSNKDTGPSRQELIKTANLLFV